MPCAEKDLKRIIELYTAIESRKAHEYAAPTYKDSPSLTEMTSLVLRQRGTDSETLEETVPALRYLADCYDKMCRPGMSVKFYKPLLEGQVLLMRQNTDDRDSAAQLEDYFYLAVKARNYYEPDDCADLVKTVSGSLSEDKMQELLSAAQKYCRSSVKQDPIEKTEAYLAVIDAVDERIDREKTMDFCLEHWQLKKRFLFGYGIDWQSPAELNPRVMFD